MLLLKLNFEQMSPEPLRDYFRELCETAREPMTADERRLHRAVRNRVAMRLAFTGT